MTANFKATREGEDGIHERAELAVREFLAFSLKQEQGAAFLRDLVAEKSEGFEFIDRLVQEYTHYLLYRGLELPINRKRINVFLNQHVQSESFTQSSMDEAIDAGFIRD